MQYPGSILRWYDVDPTVSLAVSILRNANIKDQEIVAEMILDKTKEIKPERKRNVITLLPFFKRRWYDDCSKLSLAMLKMKKASLKLQKELSIEMIDYFCATEEHISGDII